MSYPIRVKQLNKRDGYEKLVTIPSASVLTLNSVPYTILAAPSVATKAIVVTEFFIRISAGTAYASFADMALKYVGGAAATICTIPGTGFVDQTAATGVWASFNGTSSKGTIVTPGAAITLTMATGDPTTGTSPLTIKIKYKIHTVA